MEPFEAAKHIQQILDDKMGQDIRVLDLQGISDIADFFVIASGNNANHLRTMAETVEQKLFQEGIRLHHSEGYTSATWILLDFGTVLVHLFNKEDRSFYSLDRVWGDAKSVE